MKNDNLESLRAAREYVRNSLIFEAIIRSLRNAKEQEHKGNDAPGDERAA